MAEANANATEPEPEPESGTHDTLKYHLLGPSLTKAGQDAVDQAKVSEIIYNASKGSKFFNREEAKDKVLTQKIEQILTKKQRLEKLDLSRELRAADQLIAELEASRDLTQRIVHIDCDAFYAAVEQLDRPELKEVPFAVGGGVLTTCNYVARKFGCRSGMAGFVAKKLCPELLLSTSNRISFAQCLPLPPALCLVLLAETVEFLVRPNFEKYTAKAHEVRDILTDYDPRFESASIDEAYLNITEYCAQHGMTAEEAVQQMRDEIHEKTRVTVSAGIAANAKLAKICSNFNKPNGQYTLPNDRNAIMSFMRDLPTRKVNGIGRVLERELQEIGIRTCGEIYAHRHFLHQLFGEKAYRFLLGCYLGLGRTRIQPAEEYERKSVGTESTFKDISDPAELRDKLRWTAEELEKDMQKAECKGRTLVLKVKLHTYEVFTRQVVLPKATQQADELFQYSLPILMKLQHEMPNMKLRLMGLRCTNLVSTKKPDTRAFFGLQPLKTEDEESRKSGKRKIDEMGSIKDENENSGLLESETYNGDDGCPARPDSAGFENINKGVPHLPGDTEASEQWWDCPICARPQPADERRFNDHLDSCLSRQTIRDAVQKDTKESPPLPPETPAVKKSKSSGEKRRGRSVGLDDPRQKKLFFG